METSISLQLTKAQMVSRDIQEGKVTSLTGGVVTLVGLLEETVELKELVVGGALSEGLHAGSGGVELLVKRHGRVGMLLMWSSLSLLAEADYLRRLIMIPGPLIKSSDQYGQYRMCVSAGIPEN
jgi:hypothetical protein